MRPCLMLPSENPRAGRPRVARAGLNFIGGEDMIRTCTFLINIPAAFSRCQAPYLFGYLAEWPQTESNGHRDFVRVPASSVSRWGRFYEKPLVRFERTTHCSPESYKIRPYEIRHLPCSRSAVKSYSGIVKIICRWTGLSQSRPFVLAELPRFRQGLLAGSWEFHP